MASANLRPRNELLYLATVFFVVLTVYLYSAPRTVVLEDDGLFILAAYFNGISHPPGYPLFTLLAHWMTYLPIGSIAYRVHMLSAVFGALACACLYYLLRLLIPGRIYAGSAAIALGFSRIFWSQSIISEVYTLNAFLFLWLCILALRYVEKEPGTDSRRVLMLMALLYGLSLSNHWPLIILSTPVLMIIVWSRWRSLCHEMLFAVPFLLIGLLPYAWMVVRSQMGPEFSFYGQLESWRDFWFVISRKGYAGLDQSVTAGWWDKWQFCGFVLRESALQFGPFGTVFSLFGFICQWRKWPVRIGLALVTGYICNTFVLIGLLGFDYELLHRNIFRVYPIITYCIMALWLGLGMYVLVDWLAGKCRDRVGGRLLKAAAAVLLIGTALALNVSVNYRATDNWAETYAHAVLDNIEKNAILFTDGDLDMSPLGYFNKVEQLRPDVTLYNHKGVGFSNRLFFPLRNSLNERRQNIRTFIEGQTRPVYYTYGLPHDYQVIKYGLYQKINTDPEAKLEKSVATYEIVDYFKQLLVAGEPADAWESMHFKLLTTDYCALSLNLLRDVENSGSADAALTDWIKVICNGYHGLLEQINYNLTFNKIIIV